MSATRYQVQRLIEQILIEEHGSAAVTRSPISATLTSEVNRPADYVAGVRAAMTVVGVAEWVARDHAKRARGEGRSWAQIAEVLDLDTEAHDDLAAAAFLWVAPSPSQPFDRIYTSWECSSCGSRVVDRGPFGGHPDDNEEGHADGCARLAAEVAEYRRRAGWDDED